jgi:hypothetical protein
MILGVQLSAEALLSWPTPSLRATFLRSGSWPASRLDANFSLFE